MGLWEKGSAATWSSDHSEPPVRTNLGRSWATLSLTCPNLRVAAHLGSGGGGWTESTQQQPLGCPRSSTHAASRAVRKAVRPLIWTAATFSGPYGVCVIARSEGIGRVPQVRQPAPAPCGAYLGRKRRGEAPRSHLLNSRKSALDSKSISSCYDTDSVGTRLGEVLTQTLKAPNDLRSRVWLYAIRIEIPLAPGPLQGGCSGPDQANLHPESSAVLNLCFRQ